MGNDIGFRCVANARCVSADLVDGTNRCVRCSRADRRRHLGAAGSLFAEGGGARDWIGSLLASPHEHGYDACILTIGVAFLVQDGLDCGFLSGERGILFCGWIGLFFLIGQAAACVRTSCR